MFFKKASENVFLLFKKIDWILRKEDKEIDYMIEYSHFFNFAIICQYEQNFS